MKMKRHPFVSIISFFTCMAIASWPMGATATTTQASESSAREQVIVHVVNEMPDEERGLLKLVHYRGTTTSVGANVIVHTTEYEEICTEPCGVAVDISDRPILFFIRDGNFAGHGFRLTGDEEEVTLSVRPQRGGMRSAGVFLTCFLLLPVSIPLLVLGRSKVSLAPGAPSPEQHFRKLKKPKL